MLSHLRALHSTHCIKCGLETRWSSSHELSVKLFYCGFWTSLTLEESMPSDQMSVPNELWFYHSFICHVICYIFKPGYLKCSINRTKQAVYLRPSVNTNQTITIHLFKNVWCGILKTVKLESMRQSFKNQSLGKVTNGTPAIYFTFIFFFKQGFSVYP